MHESERDKKKKPDVLVVLVAAVVVLPSSVSILEIDLQKMLVDLVILNFLVLMFVLVIEYFSFVLIDDFSYPDLHGNGPFVLLILCWFFVIF